MVHDVGMIPEGCAAIRSDDPERTRQLRRRHLALLVEGLGAADGASLPGPPPAPGELGDRWHSA